MHLARQLRGWKVVEHVYHRDVAESDQDVIHGSSSSNVTLSVELTNFEHTDLSINSESTEVDAPPVNDDNANANEGNAEDDDVAHVLDDEEADSQQSSGDYSEDERGIMRRCKMSRRNRIRRFVVLSCLYHGFVRLVTFRLVMFVS
ncbi:hypothetical protein Tco_1025014 [Tanacetum coccineum]